MKRGFGEGDVNNRCDGGGDRNDRPVLQVS